MKCPGCSREITAGSAFCGFCGTRITKMTAPSAPRCTSCGAENDPGSAFCARCGQRLTAAPTSHPTAPTASAPALSGKTTSKAQGKKKRGKARFIIIAVLVLILAAGGGTLGFFAARNNIDVLGYLPWNTVGDRIEWVYEDMREKEPETEEEEPDGKEDPEEADPDTEPTETDETPAVETAQVPTGAIGDDFILTGSWVVAMADEDGMVGDNGTFTFSDDGVLIVSEPGSYESDAEAYEYILDRAGALVRVYSETGNRTILYLQSQDNDNALLYPVIEEDTEFGMTAQELAEEIAAGNIGYTPDGRPYYTGEHMTMTKMEEPAAYDITGIWSWASDEDSLDGLITVFNEDGSFELHCIGDDVDLIQKRLAAGEGFTGYGYDAGGRVLTMETDQAPVAYDVLWASGDGFTASNAEGSAICTRIDNLPEDAWRLYPDGE